ncbi:SRPBCC family protein [Streptomyces sudanensis]|uniref:SRPBCC family protein n=1 Tax=Streptomyces sudanensis TaxID=436397 RepID=UPI0020CF4FF4|nr:SRPBCC family protein [Streptomyces sudanensis]MCP9959962.1 SRPBCC family protein [Streptomyces sudanensis]MCP9988978.1 SRPBCC family protein [Streptomyces sudanensis]
MSVFRLERRTGLPPAEAWRRVTDWPAHAASVPLTRVRVLTPGPPGAGTRFTARTGIGPLGFDDPMEVVRWEPPGPGTAEPGVCRLEKHGRVVRGWAEITVRAEGPGARVAWVEELRVRGLPRWCGPLVARAGRWVFGRELERLLRGRGGGGPGPGAGFRGAGTG